MDRIVNTEIALDHVSEAIRSLAFLIAVTEQQDGSNANSLGHLYSTMARLYLKEENKDEALKAILYAEKLRPDNNAIKKLKESIMNLGADENENKPGEINSFIDSLSRDIVDENISKMLLQDVEQEAHRQELLPSSEIVPAEQLFGKAQNNRNNLSDTYDDKAYSFWKLLQHIITISKRILSCSKFQLQIMRDLKDMVCLLVSQIIKSELL